MYQLLQLLPPQLVLAILSTIFAALLAGIVLLGNELKKHTTNKRALSLIDRIQTAALSAVRWVEQTFKKHYIGTKDEGNAIALAQAAAAVQRELGEKGMKQLDRLTGSRAESEALIQTKIEAAVFATKHEQKPVVTQ
jgi:uncharacterized protein (UPF0371 family)